MPAKIIHFAALVDPDGHVSPFCARRPRALDLSKESWTLRPEAVTCKRCRAAKPKQPKEFNNA